MENFIIPHAFSISGRDLSQLTNAEGQIFWLFGLSGSGKSTLANIIQEYFFKKKQLFVILDGDQLRSGLCSNLGFSSEDRLENIRRAAEMAKIFSKNSISVLCCFITPAESQRRLIKSILKEKVFFIHLKADIETLKLRDPKGLYKKALQGEIKQFTGITAQFEEPSSTVDCSIETNKEKVEESLEKIISFILLKINKVNI